MKDEIFKNKNNKMVIGLLNLLGYIIFYLFEVYLVFEFLLYIEVCIVEG